MASLALTTTLLLSLSFLCLRDSIAAVQVLDNRFPVKEMNYPIKVSEPENYGVSRLSMAELKRRRLAGRKLMVKAAEAALMAENIHEGESKRSAGGAFYAGNYKKRERRRVHSPSVHVKFSGFIAFDADYNVARSHPPMNN